MEYKGIKPYGFQEKIIQDVLNEDGFYYTMVTGRQIGKTLLLINLLLYFAINKPRSTILWVSPYYSMAIKVLTQILDAIDGTGIVNEANKSEKIISLSTGTRIYFRSAEKPETIRGLSVNYCFIDEAQDVFDDAFYKSILPTLTAVGRKLLIAGTPKRKTWFYTYFKRGADINQKKYYSYSAPSSVSPYVDASFIEEQRRALPDGIFRQEFLAEWVDGEGAVFQNIKESCNLSNWPQSKEKTFGGLDIGTKDDYSVLTILDRAGQTLYIWRGRHLSYSEIIKNVKQIGTRYNASILVEINGVGDPIYEQLQNDYKKVEAFVTNNNSKNNIITKLISDIQDMELSLPSKELFEPLQSELEAFEYSYSPKGLITYGAPNGLHDDCVMSLALANWHRTNAKSNNIYIKKI